MRYVVTILGLLVVVGGLAALKADQIGMLIAFGEEAQAAGPPPEPVGTATSELASLEGVLTAVGSVASARGVAVSTEVPGVVTHIDFESGDEVRAGEVLVRLDTKVERAQLASAVARRELAETTLARTRQLVARGALSSQQLDTDESTLKTASSEVDALRAQIALKTIRAPFSGRLGIRQVNKGQYLSPGTAVAILETDQSLYVDFTLPQQRLADVREGMPIRVTFEGHEGAPIEGTIAAVEPSIDASTRQVRLRGSVPNDADVLRPGMFVNVTVVLGQNAPSVVVPATAVVHASYGDSVFVVADKPADEPGMRQTPDGKTVLVARQKFVRTGPQRGDFVAIEEGLAAGEAVVVAGAFKLRNGAPVVVDNTVLPEMSLDPQVENR